MNKYLVIYTSGRFYGEVHVEAYDKKQACEIARIHVQHGMKRKGKFQIYKVKQEK